MYAQGVGLQWNTMRSWAVYPLCAACAAQGFEATSMLKAKLKSKRKVHEKKRARPAPAGDTRQLILMDMHAYDCGGYHTC